LSYREEQAKFLEGTGSLVLDRRIVWPMPVFRRAPISMYSASFAQQLDYDLVTFEASDAAGKPVYHTNV